MAQSTTMYYHCDSDRLIHPAFPTKFKNSAFYSTVKLYPTPPTGGTGRKRNSINTSSNFITCPKNTNQDNTLYSHFWNRNRKAASKN